MHLLHILESFDQADRTGIGPAHDLHLPERFLQARAVLFLSCELSDHITGEAIIVSAGELMSQ